MVRDKPKRSICPYCGKACRITREGLYPEHIMRELAGGIVMCQGSGRESPYTKVMNSTSPR